jgi:hypothetical protein
MQEQYEIDATQAEPATAKPSSNGAVAADFSITNTNVSSIFYGEWFITRRGTFAWNFGFPDAIVNDRSQVAVSITEVNAANEPFLGNAGMSVLNVVPQRDGTVTVRANVAWDSPLKVKLNFIIVN